MSSESRLRWCYVLADYISTNIAMLLFNISRYYILPSATKHFYSIEQFLTSYTLIAGQILFPLFMLFIYYLSGQYNNVYGKSRTSELTTTLTTAFIGTLSLTLTVLINDLTTDRTRDYSLFLIILSLLFVLIYIPRYILTRHISRRIQSGKIRFNTVIVGYSSMPHLFPRQINENTPVAGSVATALIDFDNKSSGCSNDTHLPIYDIDNIETVFESLDIKNIVVIPHPGGWELTLDVVNRLFRFDRPIYVTADRLPPYMFSTRISALTSQPFIDVSRTHIPASTVNIKRTIDVFLSSIMLLITSIPLLFVAIAIKVESTGPAIYRQRRLGLHGKPFTIYKMRTMYNDAETEGHPELSQKNDRRITGIGRFLRKYRIDELPQFFNVLKGDMSIVGPRPERPYYSALLMERDPSYSLIHRVRPGITSLGMVKYGYASSVEQMLQRMRYDMIYLDNISIITDIKILFYTAHTVLSGKGL